MRSASGLPATDVLERQLASVLGPIVISDRRMNPAESRHPSEIVTCERAGAELRVLCKHATRRTLDLHGLAAGVDYEAVVYRVALGECSLSHPTSYGIAIDPESGARALLIEFLDDCQRVQKSGDPCALARAASWIGSFHAAQDDREPPAALNVYRSRYFSGWARRAWAFAGGSHRPSAICGWFAEEAMPALVTGAATIVHGEYYPDNVLYRDGTVFPVDWEWAAIGAGESDLAALTEGSWPEDVVAGCVDAYCESRWPHGAPAGFAERLGAARAYLHLRWLGGRPERAATGEAVERWERLERIADAWDYSLAGTTGTWLRSG
jgi:aminoglycoside phosphotransferase (APT) family kinase protein